MTSISPSLRVAPLAWLAIYYRYGRETAALAGNCVWFGAATLFFGVLPHVSVNWVIPPKDRTPMLMAKMQDSIRFLGGINGGMLTLSVLALLARVCGRGQQHDQEQGLFAKAAERRVIFVACAVGHISQAVAQRAPKLNPILWYIYVMDWAQGLANLACAWAAKDDKDA